MQYDHVEFQGAVPRSLIPPTSLATASAPVLRLASLAGAVRDGLDAQVIGAATETSASEYGPPLALWLTGAASRAVRLVLAFTSASALVFLASRVRSTYGGRTARYLLLLSATQFHVPFWAGRTVPNMLAFPLGASADSDSVSGPGLQDARN